MEFSSFSYRYPFNLLWVSILTLLTHLFFIESIKRIETQEKDFVLKCDFSIFILKFYSIEGDL